MSEEPALRSLRSAEGAQMAFDGRMSYGDYLASTRFC
jgi:hypothetical protein